MGKLCFTILLVLFLQDKITAQSTHVSSINIKPVSVSPTLIVNDTKKVVNEAVSVSSASVSLSPMVLDTTVIIRPTYDLNVVERKD